MENLRNFQPFKVGVSNTYSRGKDNFFKKDKNVEVYIKMQRCICKFEGNVIKATLCLL